MSFKYNNISKSLGPVAAHLVVTLYEKNRLVFHRKEAQTILGENHSAPRILQNLLKHGIISRLKPGTYSLIPFELGFEKNYLGNPTIVARELATKSRKNDQSQSIADYYISHGSAFELHQMVTQPQFVTYVTSPRLIRSRTIQGAEFRFVRCKTKDLFGLCEMWVDKNNKVQASDIERTLLDGLKQPKYCGGLSEVAKAFSIKKGLINSDKLIEYAMKLNIGVVISRLGIIMETYQIGSIKNLEQLQKKLTKTYHLLDPDLPASGTFLAKWRLRLNITKDELMALRGT